MDADDDQVLWMIYVRKDCGGPCADTMKHKDLPPKETTSDLIPLPAAAAAAADVRRDILPEGTWTLRRRHRSGGLFRIAHRADIWDDGGQRLVVRTPAGADYAVGNRPRAVRNFGIHDRRPESTREYLESMPLAPDAVDPPVGIPRRPDPMLIPARRLERTLNAVHGRARSLSAPTTGASGPTVSILLGDWPRTARRRRASSC